MSNDNDLGPPNDEGPHRGPTSKGATTPHTDKWNHTASQRRLIAAARCEPHEWSGYRDPLFDPPKPELTVDSYEQAAQHLLERGLTPAPSLSEMRIMFRRGGDDRRLVSAITERWEVAVT